MSELKLLYLMSAAYGPMDTKLGITTLSKAEVRLGSYQNALGPRQLCQWPRCWVGPAAEIERLERVLKRHFKADILAEGRGYTEWVSEHTWQDIAPIVDEMIQGHRFMVTLVDDSYLPLSSQNLDAYRAAIAIPVA